MTELEEKKEEKNPLATHATITEGLRTHILGYLEENIAECAKEVEARKGKDVPMYIYTDIARVSGLINGLTLAYVITIGESQDYHHRLDDIREKAFAFESEYHKANDWRF